MTLWLLCSALPVVLSEPSSSCELGAWGTWGACNKDNIQLRARETPLWYVASLRFAHTSTSTLTPLRFSSYYSWCVKHMGMDPSNAKDQRACKELKVQDYRQCGPHPDGPDCVLGRWGSWSACDKYGMQTTRRAVPRCMCSMFDCCPNKDRKRLPEGSDPLNDRECVDEKRRKCLQREPPAQQSAADTCTMGPWEPFTPCNGFGFQLRTRTVPHCMCATFGCCVKDNVPNTMLQGNTMDGKHCSYIESHQCAEQHIKGCKLSPWGGWGACNMEGLRIRQRPVPRCMCAAFECCSNEAFVGSDDDNATLCWGHRNTDAGDRHRHRRRALGGKYGRPGHRRQRAPRWHCILPVGLQ